MTINRDTIVAIVLLALSGVLWNASYDIELTNYGTMPSAVWPRIIIVAIGLFAALMLLMSLVRPEPRGEADGAALPLTTRYRNATIIYALFLLFLLTLPTLGMHLGGALFVFLALTALGRPSPKLIAVHAAVAVGSIGIMWTIFTFGLRVILPQGTILPI
jgi:putative tricarboxylic transport membrane protein